MFGLKHIADQAFRALSPRMRKQAKAERDLEAAYELFLAPTIGRLHFLARNSNSLEFQYGIYIPVLRPFFAGPTPNHIAIKTEITKNPEGFLAQALGGLEFDMRGFPLTKQGERDPLLQGVFDNEINTYNHYRRVMVKTLGRKDLNLELVQGFSHLTCG